MAPTPWKDGIRQELIQGAMTSAVEADWDRRAITRAVEAKWSHAELAPPTLDGEWRGISPSSW